MPSKPHGPRHPGRGWLKNGGTPDNWDNAPRCGAKTRAGTPCRSAAMKNGRCMMHGGMSTGPRTPEGLNRIKASRTIHGRYSADNVARRRAARAALNEVRALLRALEAS
jgi:hypothetical protein